MAAAGEESWGLAPGESAPGRGAAVSRQRSGRRSAGEPPDTLRPAGLPAAPTPGLSLRPPRSLAPCQSAQRRWRARGAVASLPGQGGSTGRSLSPSAAVSRFVKYTGYGNAAGLLAARGLMAGGREEGEYSEDEDTDTEEYKEAKPK